MNSDADKLWNELFPKYRRHKDLCPMTPEEGEEAFKTAPRAPLSEEQIRSIVRNVTTNTPPEMDQCEPEWCEDEDFEEIESDLQLLHRNEGDEPDPTAEETERKLREEMLNDDQNGMEGQAETP